MTQEDKEQAAEVRQDLDLDLVPTEETRPEQSDYSDTEDYSDDVVPNYEVEETNKKDPSSGADSMERQDVPAETTFEYVSSRLGGVKDETRKIAEEIFYVAQAAGHLIWFMWGMGTSKEHASGLALDLMVRTEAAGDWVRNYVWSNRARLRLRHVIWERHITSTVVQPGVRRLMEDRGNPTANHYDHDHVWLFAGAYQPPTFPSRPTPVIPVPLAIDNELGPKTIRRWQEIMGTKADGVISPENSQLVRAVQKWLKDRVDPNLKIDGQGIKQDGRTYKTVFALQRYLKSPVDGKMSVPKSLVVGALQRRLNEGRF